MKSLAIWKKYGKWICVVWSVFTLGLALLTLHDMQTAEGTGLYLAFQAGTRERGPYDLLVDLAGMMCLAGLVLLPCILLKQREPESFFRFLAAYLAFLPTVSTAALVHLLDGTEDIVIRQSLLEGNLPEALREGMAGIIPLLQVGVPVLVLAAALCREAGEGKPGKAENEGKRVAGKAAWAAMAAVLLLIFPAVVFPALTDICVYVIFYALLVYGFRLWGKLEAAYPGFRTWGWLLFVFFWFRGLDRMLEVMSIYHL